jgi:hypothetical protein
MSQFWWRICWKKLNTCCICCNKYFHAIVFYFCTRPQGNLLCGWASYIETSVRNQCRCSFYCALFTLHVSAPIGGHLQVVWNTKNSKAVTVYVNGSVVSVCIKANAAVRWL